ncbi:MAG: response regulator transcription factor [Alphaproteobacteria bacterium]|nr:response regulator transcription factor [Alphaproteobacteria bacterium]
MTIRALCVDDEPLARQGLALALKQHPDFELVADYGSVEDALAAVHGDIDVLFLDIEMPRQSGFDLLKVWPRPLPLVVFVTAYNQYALKAFEEQALDYVLKPIDHERFAAVADRIRSQLEKDRRELEADDLVAAVESLKRKLARKEAAISVKTDEGYFRVELQDLLYIEAAGDHTFLYLPGRHLITRQTLKHYRDELADHDFHQVHKSVMVNAKHVVKASPLKFSDYELELTDGTKVRMSRRYKPALATLLPS